MSRAHVNALKITSGAELFIGRFREPGPPGRSLPRTIDAFIGPSSEIPCPTTSLSQRHSKMTVVHGSENQLFSMLQHAGWTSYPERPAVEHRRVDHGGAHILVAK
jgi:hypothetical protein